MGSISFLFNTTATTDIYTLSLHDALPICGIQGDVLATDNNTVGMGDAGIKSAIQGRFNTSITHAYSIDRKSGSAGMPRPISYAVFCLKKKKKRHKRRKDVYNCVVHRTRLL